jgi:Ca-activated chloride channel family protein
MIPGFLSPRQRRRSASRTAALTSAFILAGVFAVGRPVLGQIAPPPDHRPVPPIRPIPAPGNAVTVKSVAVNATIRDGVAETEVSHVLANRTGIPQEANLLFPIPSGASISSFALYDGEKRMDARLLDKDEACRTYEEIVRRRRDPALLTFEGRSALRARVFPVEPNSERRITLKLVTVLPREGDAKKYAWTLVGPHLPGAAMPESVSVHVTITNSQPIGNVYSPTQSIRVRRDSDTQVVVNWNSDKDRAALAENPEFTLYATPGRGRSVALSVLTYNAALPQVASLGGGARQSGYFLVVASPTIANAEKNALPRHVVMVLDRSGSMQGKKIEQARSALRFALGKLRAADSFNIMTFSDQVERFSPEMVGATADNIKRANTFVDDIVADGGTNINDALKTGLSQFAEKGSANTLLFFTDGLPTVGVKSQDQIVQNAVTESGGKARTFVFGVGYDVDVPFLDNVARTLRGDADYVRPDEDIEVKTSQFVAKTSAPVMENLKLSVDGIRTGEIYPRPDSLPDLFAGSQLVLVGRYTGGSEKVRLTLTGDANGKPQRYDMSANFPAVDTDSDFLPRLWASRKIGYLMDEARLAKDEEAKKETIDQIIALSKEFGILTPYTALFVPEPAEGGAPRPVELQLRESLSRSGGGFGGGISAGAAPALDAAVGGRGARQGEVAVNASQASRAQRYQAVVGNSAAVKAKAGLEQKKDEELARRIQNVGSRAFYQVGSLWQDATYDAKKQKQIVKIKLYSPAYFALTRRNQSLAQWAALGENVLVTANATQAIQFGPEGKESLTESEVKELAGG